MTGAITILLQSSYTKPNGFQGRNPEDGAHTFHFALLSELLRL